MHLIHSTHISLQLLFLTNCLHLVVSDLLPTCRPENFTYGFTECDEYGGRWRVSVPSSPSTCTGGAPNAPIRVDNCFTSCDSGHFFNSTSLLCEKCEPGFYSLGGGIQIASFNWSSLPSGFHINTETTRHSCSGWNVNLNYIESVSNFSGGGCVSIMTYTVKIVKKGNLRFIYQYYIPDDLSLAILFSFHYRNYDINANEDSSGFTNDNNVKFPSATNEQKWKTIEVKLMKPGLYVFAWKSVTIGHANDNKDNIKVYSPNIFDGSDGRHYDTGFIRIKSISVDGVGYASECSRCEPGTYNDKVGADACKLCPPNTAFSEYGAIKCNPCDSLTEYSPKGSEKCLSRPLCGENDYYETIGDCNLRTKLQEVQYNWIEPKICRDENNILPPLHHIECNESTVTAESNQKCNLGMQLKDDGNCHFCEPNEYRDGSTDKCKQCPPFTSPLYALSYNIWHTGKPGDTTLPKYFSTHCARDTGEYRDTADYDCESEITWQSTIGTKNYIRTTPSSLLGSYLILSLAVPGFRKQNGGEISFNFEIECEEGDKCQFTFMESKGRKLSQQTTIVRQWNGDITQMQSFKYRIEQNISVAFSWVFRRENSFQSNAKLYEVIVTDTSVGGAIKCHPCPPGIGSNCVPCPYGQYLNIDELSEIEHTRNRNRNSRQPNNLQATDVSKCRQCPQNTVVNTSLSFPIGRNNSCIACGPGLLDDMGLSCFSNCSVSIGDDIFDLSQLKQPLLYKANPLFTAGGTQYYHLFNITLCGKPEQKSLCINNVTSFGATAAGFDEDLSVYSMICRSTILPDRDQIYSTQSVSLGDDLIGISRAISYKSITVHPDFQNTSSDLHFYFSTKLPTVACANGRRLTLTLRCAPELEEDVIISTPKSCPGGTCDGCSFHLLVRTKTAAACRLCRASDYETVVGECVNGLQQIHFVNPKSCIIAANGKIPIETRPCSLIPKQVQIGIALVSALGIILLALVFHFWKKNRSLEYKYCKLIENEKTAECCAEDEDDDDEDENVVVRGRKHKDVNDKDYETIQLTNHDRDHMI